MTRSKKHAADDEADDQDIPSLEPKRKASKKSYMVDDEDEEHLLDLDDTEDGNDTIPDVDPDEKEIQIPKTFDPFDDDEEEDDF